VNNLMRGPVFGSESLAGGLEDFLEHGEDKSPVGEREDAMFLLKQAATTRVRFLGR
jgi:hypothetical protein